MHESKALCFEVKICVRFGVIFYKKVFTFAIIFSFLEGILEKFSSRRCRARYSGADFSPASRSRGAISSPFQYNKRK